MNSIDTFPAVNGRSKMANLIVLVMSVVQCVVAVSGAKCPPGWYNWRRSCYNGLDVKLDREGALGACQQFVRGSLIIPDSQQEHEFIMALRDEVFSEWSNSKPMWVGCDFVEGELRCVNGQSANNVNRHWSPTVDATAGGGCVFMGGWRDGDLFYDGCSANRFVMCEMPVITPATYCASLGADGRVARRCLHNHELKNLTVRGVSECGQACWADHRCQSFNLKDGPVKTCQLNDAASHEVDSGDFQEEATSMFFDLE